MDHYFTNNITKSNLQKKEIRVNNKTFNFYTDNGVFSKKGLDFGTRSLIDALLKEEIFGDVLDLGCGYGSIGIILSSFFDINVDMVDVNLRALHLAKMNKKENGTKNVNIFESNIYENINKKYDYIITNPPIRAGKEVYYKFITQGKDHLKENGTLYFVINKDQGAKSIIKDMGKYYNVEVILKNKGFFVIKCNL